MSQGLVLAVLAVMTAAAADTLPDNRLPAYRAWFMAAAIYLQVVLKAP